MSLDLAEVDRALAAVQHAGVPFQIGFNRRFDPGHAAVAAADVGEPHIVRITSRDPAPPPLAYVRVSGGIFLDMTIHDFDMARFVAKSEVVEVYRARLGAHRPRLRRGRRRGHGGVLLEHENGCFTTIDNSRQAVYGYDQRVEVFGSAGMAASENPLAHAAIVRTAAGVHAATLPYFFLERYIPSYLREWEAFVHAIATGTPPLVGPADARAPLVIGLAAWQSLREGTAVFDSLRLDGKVIVVTGATQGLGAAIARRAHGLGAQVAVCGRNRERGEAIAAELDGLFVAGRARPTPTGDRGDHPGRRRALRPHRRARERRRALHARHARRHDGRAVGPPVRGQRAGAVPAHPGGGAGDAPHRRRQRREHHHDVQPRRPARADGVRGVEGRAGDASPATPATRCKPIASASTG